jgi:hypothetical protein
MKSKQRHLGFIVVLFLAVALVLVPGFTRPARAAGEDVAMFYDDLGQMGQWFEYENYGPVWHPSNVEEDWRPYTNGRWVPTDDGYVFESQEPWAWATYHYGNWMPTEGYGWVWVPGRTWYPSTVEWRTSPEDAPVDTSYIGWAPMPPPNYVPPPSYAPPSGYYPGAPMADVLTSPFWIFARAASFLLGFGQPYTPAYSYMAQPVLVSPAYVPVFFGQTMIVPTYMTPAYYPAAFLGGAVIGSYAWGPSNRYISRVTHINQTVINNTIINNSTHITRIHNVRPPRDVLDRHPHIRDITPPALVQGHRLPPSRPVTNIRQAQANLNKPNIVRPPKNVPPLKADIPRVQPVSHRPGEGIRGAGLPTRATMPLTQQQRQQIQKLPPNKQIRTERPIKPVLTQERAKPGVTRKPGEMRPGPTGRPGQVQPGVFKPGVPPPGQKGLSQQERQRLEQEHQRLQRGGQPAQQQPQQRQREQQQRQQQLQQQRQREQQQGQQQRQREQQQGQQQRQREQQLQQQRQREQQQRQREQQQGQQQRQGEQQLQQQRQREQQQRQQQLQQQRQQQQQQQRQREQQLQQQRQQQQQQQRQQQLQQQRQQQLQQQRQQQLQQQQQQRQQQQQQQQKQKQQKKKEQQQEQHSRSY